MPKQLACFCTMNLGNLGTDEAMNRGPFLAGILVMVFAENGVGKGDGAGGV